MKRTCQCALRRAPCLRSESRRILLALGVLLLAALCPAQSLSPDKPAREYIYVGGRLLAVETPAGGNASAIAPFGSVMEWNRNDNSQFSIINVGTDSNIITPTLRTTQADASYTTISMLEFTLTPGAGWARRYFLSKQAYAPTADEDLVIEADVFYDAIDQLNGLGCFDPNNPTNNYYLLARNRYGAYRLRKSIAGTLYTQGQDSVSGGSLSNVKGQKTRIRFVLTSAGGVRVYTAGMVVFDLPMTLGNATVLAACRVGFVLSPWAVGWGFSFSRLRVFRMKADGEQMF